MVSALSDFADAAQRLADDFSELDEYTKDIQNTVDTHDGKIEDLECSIDDHQKYIDSLTEEAEEREKRVRELEEIVEDLESRLNSLELKPAPDPAYKRLASWYQGRRAAFVRYIRSYRK